MHLTAGSEHTHTHTAAVLLTLAVTVAHAPFDCMLFRLYEPYCDIQTNNTVNHFSGFGSPLRH